MKENVDIPEKISSPGKVLVVDDDRVIRETFAAFLEDCNYSVVVANDAVSGIEMYDATSPDVVLLDIRMPGEINGIDVLKHISEKNSRVPVIMISGMASMDDAVSSLRHGAWDYLKKPVLDLDILQHVVDRAYDKMRLEKERVLHLEQITSANEKLQAAVDEATAAKLQAEKANLAKSEFLKKMSNELRVPALGVESMIDILLSSGLSEEQHHYARVIQSSILSLSSSLNELFDYSRIETRTLNLEKVNFNIQGIINEISEKARLQSKNEEIRFELKIHPDVPLFVQGDPWRLGQVLYILLENAYKFTRNGTIALMVTIDDETETASTLKFTVADTGIGISSEGLASLFEAFTQADDIAGAYSGIGLGLALAKQISSLFSGQIGVSSAVGKGSTFWFTAKLAKQPARQQRDDTDIGRVVNSISQSPGGMLNILLAEKNRDAQLVGTAFLKRLGCSFKTAMTSTQALEFLEEEHFDVLLLDLELGEMGGLETAGVIRSPISAVQNHRIPIVAVSSLYDNNIKTRCARVGINNCIPKPYTFAQLLSALEKSVAVAG